MTEHRVEDINARLREAARCWMQGQLDQRTYRARRAELLAELAGVSWGDYVPAMPSFEEGDDPTNPQQPVLTDEHLASAMPNEPAAAQDLDDNEARGQWVIALIGLLILLGILAALLSF